MGCICVLACPSHLWDILFAPSKLRWKAAGFTAAGCDPLANSYMLCVQCSPSGPFNLPCCNSRRVPTAQGLCQGCMHASCCQVCCLYLTIRHGLSGGYQRQAAVRLAGSEHVGLEMLGMMCRAFQAWAEKAAHKRDMRQKLLTVSQLLMHGSMARCFQAWQQDTQVCYSSSLNKSMLCHHSKVII